MCEALWNVLPILRLLPPLPLHPLVVAAGRTALQALMPAAWPGTPAIAHNYAAHEMSDAKVRTPAAAAAAASDNSAQQHQAAHGDGTDNMSPAVASPRVSARKQPPADQLSSEAERITQDSAAINMSGAVACLRAWRLLQCVPIRVRLCPRTGTCCSLLGAALLSHASPLPLTYDRSAPHAHRAAAHNLGAMPCACVG